MDQGIDTVYVDNITGYDCAGAVSLVDGGEDLNVIEFILDFSAENTDEMLMRHEYLQRNDLWPAEGPRYVVLSQTTWDVIGANCDEQAQESLHEDLELIKEFPYEENVLYLYCTEAGFKRSYLPT